jgi:hypothetical protein
VSSPNGEEHERDGEEEELQVGSRRQALSREARRKSAEAKGRLTTLKRPMDDLRVPKVIRKVKMNLLKQKRTIESALQRLMGRKEGSRTLTK